MLRLTKSHHESQAERCKWFNHSNKCEWLSLVAGLRPFLFMHIAGKWLKVNFGIRPCTLFRFSTIDFQFLHLLLSEVKDFRSYRISPPSGLFSMDVYGAYLNQTLPTKSDYSHHFRFGISRKSFLLSYFHFKICPIEID